MTSAGCGIFDSIESNNRTCPFTNKGIRDKLIHSIIRQTADLMISPPRPRYNRFRSILGTSSVNNSSILLGRKVRFSLFDNASKISAMPNTAPCLVNKSFSSKLLSSSVGITTSHKYFGSSGVNLYNAFDDKILILMSQ